MSSTQGPGRWYLAQSAQVILNLSATMGARLMLGYRALDLGADVAFLGILVSALAFPALFVSLPAGRLSDRLGGTPLVVVGSLIVAGGLVLTAFIPSLAVLLLGAGMTGLGNIFIVVGNQTFVATAAQQMESTEGAFGTFTTSVSIGQMIGPPITTFLSSIEPGHSAINPDTGVGLLTCAGMSLLAIVFCVTMSRTEHRLQPKPGTETKRAPGGTISVMKDRTLWRAVVVSGTVLVTADLLYSFVPVWATERQVDANTAGLLLSLRAGICVLSRLRLGWLVEHFGRKTILTFSLSIGVAALLFFPFANVWGAIPVMIILGISTGTPQPLTMSWVVSRTDPSLHGTALGLRMTANNLLQISFPVVIATLGGPFGIAGVFWITATMLGSSVLMVAPFKE